MKKPTFTVGIEEEYQTIDPTTRDLRSHIHSEIIAKGKLRMEERIKAEMHQSVVEVGTGVCKNIKEAKAEVCQLRTEMVKLAHENGLLLAAGATHPFADWGTRDLSRRALSPGRRRHAAGRTRQPHLRIARARWDGRPRDHYPSDELDALLLAAPAGALGEFAILAWNEHRVEIVSLQSL